MIFSGIRVFCRRKFHYNQRRHVSVYSRVLPADFRMFCIIMASVFMIPVNQLLAEAGSSRHRTAPASASDKNLPDLAGDLRGFVIVVDPGHGGTAETDTFRVGPGGEREEWINLRVSLMLRDLLTQAGATVYLTRTEDVHVELAARADLARDRAADVFVSVHHNATADASVNFPIFYFHGNAGENRASVLLGRYLAREIREAMFDAGTPVSLVSDHTIFPTRGARVLRDTYGIPAILAEASFFTNPEEEARLKTESWNRVEAEALFRGIRSFLLSNDPGRAVVLPRFSTGQVQPLAVFEQADRMRPEALEWKSAVAEARALLDSALVSMPQPAHPDAETRKLLEQALARATLSVRAFPDSYVAAEAHALRAEIFSLLGRAAEADDTARRIREFFVEI